MFSFIDINDVLFNHYFVIGGLFLSYLVYRIIHSLLSGNNYMQTKYKIRGHTWRSIQCNKSVPFNIFCTICGELMLPSIGLFCECCAISACKRCHNVVDKKIKCKSVTWPSDKVFVHHWVNVGVVRGESSDHHEDSVKQYFCCWCQQTRPSIDTSTNEECNFQKYKNIIIPPSCVQFDKGKVVEIKPLNDENWEPLIVFANRKSGSNQSDEVLSLFRGLLNPIQVVDLSECPPETAARWLPPRVRVLAAGGDGTVAWVLSALLTAPHVNAAVAILPMGTGNDLSRTLGWGATCSSELDAHSIIESVVQAKEQLLDRWKVTIKPKHSRLRRSGSRSLFAYNYVSVGVDAQVALDFHRARTQFLYRYASRTLNYAAYALLGATRALSESGGGLALRVRADGRALTALPPLQALVLLNIRCWGAGVPLWEMGSEDEVGEQNLDDGKLEVVGISSSFHIARLQCGLAEPYRFTQASTVKIELSESCAMQVDGEPWLQRPADVILEPHGRARLLRQHTAQ